MDINNDTSLPSLSTSYISIPLYRYSKVGVVVTKVLAYDYDAGKNAVITYYIRNDSNEEKLKANLKNSGKNSKNVKNSKSGASVLKASDMFGIEARTGLIKVIINRFNQVESIILEVVAIDQGDPPLQQSLLLKLILTEDFDQVQRHLVLNHRAINYIKQIKHSFLSSEDTQAIFKFKKALKNKEKIFLDLNKKNFFNKSNSFIFQNNDNNFDKLIYFLKEHALSHMFNSTSIESLTAIFFFIIILFTMLICILICIVRRRMRYTKNAQSAKMQLRNRSDDLLSLSVGTASEKNTNYESNTLSNKSKKDMNNSFISTNVVCNQNFVDALNSAAMQNAKLDLNNVRNNIPKNKSYNENILFHHLEKNEMLQDKLYDKTLKNYHHSPFIPRCKSQNHNIKYDNPDYLFYTFNKNNHNNVVYLYNENAQFDRNYLNNNCDDKKYVITCVNDERSHFKPYTTVCTPNNQQLRSIEENNAYKNNINKDMKSFKCQNNSMLAQVNLKKK